MILSYDVTNSAKRDHSAWLKKKGSFPEHFSPNKSNKQISRTNIFHAEEPPSERSLTTLPDVVLITRKTRETTAIKIDNMDKPFSYIFSRAANAQQLFGTENLNAIRGIEVNDIKLRCVAREFLLLVRLRLELEVKCFSSKSFQTGTQFL